MIEGYIYLIIKKSKILIQKKLEISKYEISLLLKEETRMSRYKTISHFAENKSVSIIKNKCTFLVG
jgi:hypothetical protein